MPTTHAPPAEPPHAPARVRAGVDPSLLLADLGHPGPHAHPRHRDGGGPARWAAVALAGAAVCVAALTATFGTAAVADLVVGSRTPQAADAPTGAPPTRAAAATGGPFAVRVPARVTVPGDGRPRVIEVSLAARPHPDAGAALVIASGAGTLATPGGTVSVSPTRVDATAATLHHVRLEVSYDADASADGPSCGRHLGQVDVVVDDPATGRRARSPIAVHAAPCGPGAPRPDPPYAVHVTDPVPGGPGWRNRMEDAAAAIARRIP